MATSRRRKESHPLEKQFQEFVKGFYDLMGDKPDVYPDCFFDTEEGELITIKNFKEFCERRGIPLVP